MAWVSSLLMALHSVDASAGMVSIPGKPMAATKSAGVSAPIAPAAQALTQSLVALPAPTPQETQDWSARLAQTDNKRFLVGMARPVTTPNRQLSKADWTQTGDGWETGFAIKSTGARGLRVRLALAGLPAGSWVDVQGPGVSQRLSWNSVKAEQAAAETAGAWLPHTSGDTQWVSLRVTGDAPPAFVTAAVTMMSHWMMDLKDTPTVGQSASCQEDIACVPNPSPAYMNAVRSTARLSFIENGLSYVCTGTLLSDGDTASEAPYLLTAAHCIDTAAAAATLVSFWNFEANACGSKSAATYVQVSGGARLLHVNSTTDVSLLMLNQPAPAGAWFAGWDANPPGSNESGISLHHPRGDLKKVSVAQMMGATNAGSGNASFTSVAWLSGTTEPGSSGAALFTLSSNEYKVRGALLGGSATCTTSGQPQNSANRDLYSRLDTDYVRLRDIMLSGPKPLQDYSDVWMNPGELGWVLNIRQGSDQNLFVVWNTYDDTGAPQWFVALGGKWSSVTRYSATLYRGSGTPYRQVWKSAQFAMQAVGTLNLDFAASGAQMTVDMNGMQINRPIARAGL